jgi:hypothetical protein
VSAVGGGFNLEALIDAVATAVAAKLRSEGIGTDDGGVLQRLLDVDAAAKYLSRTPQAVRHLVSTGKIPAVKIDGRVQLDRKDLDAVIENSKERAL